MYSCSDWTCRAADLLLQSPPPPSSGCYERNHFCCHLQSVPNYSLCFTEWGGAVTWKMSSSEVHEGVKLQTPLCPRPRASKGISSFIDRAAEFLADGGGCCCCCWPTTSSSNPDCFCFQVTSYLLLQLFQFLRACCMKTEGSVGNVHKPPRQTIQKKHIEIFSLSRSVGDTDPVNATQLHQMNNQINVLVH